MKVLLGLRDRYLQSILELIDRIPLIEVRERGLRACVHADDIPDGPFQLFGDGFRGVVSGDTVLFRSKSLESVGLPIDKCYHLLSLISDK